MSESAKNKISYRVRKSRVHTVKTGSRLNNPLFYLRLIGHIATSLKHTCAKSRLLIVLFIVPNQA